MPHPALSLPFQQWTTVLPTRKGKGRAVARRSMAGPQRWTQPVFVINLRRSPERWERVSAQLRATGLAFERIEAVDGRLLSDEQLSACYDAELNRNTHYKPLTRGDIACYMSHLRALEQLVASGAPYALILEDDVVLGEQLLEALNAVSSVTDSWGILKLGSLRSKPLVASRQLGRFKLCHYRRLPTSAYAHVVSREAALRILEARRVFARPYDVDLQRPWETGVEVLGLEPFTVRVNEEIASDIRSCGARPKAHRPAFAWLQRLSVDARQFGYVMSRYGVVPALRSLVSPRGAELGS